MGHPIVEPYPCWPLCSWSFCRRPLQRKMRDLDNEASSQQLLQKSCLDCVPRCHYFGLACVGMGHFTLIPCWSHMVTPKFSCHRSYKDDPFSNVSHVKIPNSRHFPFCLKTPNGPIRKRAPFRGVALQCCPSAVQADKLRQLFMKQRLAV